MEFSREFKIQWIPFEGEFGIVKKKTNNPERITFVLKGIKFTTMKEFNSEEKFQKDFESGEEFICHHYFEATVVEASAIRQYKVKLVKDGLATAVEI